MELSVVIPTYNRKEILVECLKSIFNQDYPKDKYEIIVIDDGSTDGTEEMVKELQKSALVELRYFKQDHKGPAAARNVGISNSRDRIILFAGDDCIADRSMIKEHMHYHGIYHHDNIAILGYTTWHPQMRMTPFMYWLEHGGPQFSYFRFKNGEEVDAFWTCNISLKRDFILKNDGFFDEDFPYAAHEDTELGYRMKRKGLRIIFNKNAVTYHFHHTTLEKYCYRQRIVGRSAVILDKKYPSVFHIVSQKGERRMKAVWSILELTVPFLKKIASRLDQIGIPLPHTFYRLIMGYYYRIGIAEMSAHSLTNEHPSRKSNRKDSGFGF